MSTRKELIKMVKQSAHRKTKLHLLNSEKELERIEELRAMGPLAVRRIDIPLASKGWIDVYDDEPGNESVDLNDTNVYYRGHFTMPATDLIERAEEEFRNKPRK